MSYKSPIEIIYGEMTHKLENEVFTVIQNIGINVDKDELIRALAYDRDQYHTGYSDAMMSAVEVVRCKDCKYYQTDDIKCPCNIGLAHATTDAEYTWIPEPDWFCADGERREDDAKEST